jgi:hypothetical protein
MPKKLATKINTLLESGYLTTASLLLRRYSDNLLNKSTKVKIRTIKINKIVL